MNCLVEEFMNRGFSQSTISFFSLDSNIVTTIQTERIKYAYSKTAFPSRYTHIINSETIGIFCGSQLFSVIFGRPLIGFYSRH